MDTHAELRLSQKNDLLETSASAAEALLRGVGYSTFQNPVNGAAQLVEKTTGINVLDKVQMISPPDSSTELNQIAGRLGGFVGTGIHCFAMVKAGGAIAGSEWTAIGFRNRALATGALGAAFGGFLTPVAKNDGNFWSNRAENAVVGLAAMSSLSILHGPTRLPGEPTFRLKELGACGVIGFAGTAFAELGGHPANWKKIQWWPAEPGHKLNEQELAEAQPKLTVFLGNNVRPISDLHRYP